MKKTASIVDNLAWFRSIGLLTEEERLIVESIFDPEFEFAEALGLAESIHVHLKVDDTEALPVEEFAKRGGEKTTGKAGYRKHYFPDGLNMIFSTIPIAQDDLAETPESWRPRPFVDHIGIDLREETDSVRAGFGSLSKQAGELGWGLIPQGGKGRPVYCCHIEVAEKRWIYPPEANARRAGIPLEFSFGQLKLNDFLAGCDLRPASPVPENT